MTPTESLRAFVRYQTHGGYVWAAVCSDGGLLCERCARENYRQIYRETRNGGRFDTGWQVIGLTNSGEADCAEYCAGCNRELWTDPNS